MKQSNSEASNIEQMADILLVLPPESALPDYWLLLVIAAGLSMLLVLVLLFWKNFNSPVKKLERYLKLGKLSPREAAHCLAQLKVTDNEKINEKIDQLRFQRQAPGSNDLLSLIDKVKNVR